MIQKFFTRLESFGENGQDFSVYCALIVDGVIIQNESGLIHAFAVLNEERASNAAKSVHERYVQLLRKPNAME